MTENIKSFYRHCFQKIDKFLLGLCEEEKLRRAVFLSSVARIFFLREYGKKRVNYRNLEELKQLVMKAANEQSAKPIENCEKIHTHSEVKILFIFIAKSNYYHIWTKTAEDAGFLADIFLADKISYLSPSVDNFDVMNRRESELLRKVKEFLPHLIFLDVNYLGNPNTINNDLIGEIRKIHKCKIVGFIGDYYSKEALRVAEYWSKSLEVVLCSAPGMSNEGIRNFHYVHYFANERFFYPTREKKYDIFFFGSGNISRYVYLAFVKLVSKKKGYTCKISVHNHHDNSVLKYEDYACLMRAARAVLNLSARPVPNVRVVTGRVQEAIASKSLLIEEKNDSVTNIFTPYAHFIPFDSTKELAIAIDFAVNCGKLVDKITEAAYEKYWREHNSKTVWNRILSLCGI